MNFGWDHSVLIGFYRLSTVTGIWQEYYDIAIVTILWKNKLTLGNILMNKDQQKKIIKIAFLVQLNREIYNKTASCRMINVVLKRNQQTQLWNHS